MVEGLKYLKKIIDRYNHCKVRDVIDLERIDKSAKEGGFLPFLPLIFAGLAAVGAATGWISAAVKAANANKAAEAEKSEKRRHNMEMEKNSSRFGSSRYSRDS
ncbi:hypothetical protein LOTGIDRAFT_163642 [Lottia gigantea]|uniref:Uncharacterized protein n=1 Tax=Lottia gigantea TaxID=225164 RepID=V4A6W5_LOTGI|nr:hypothetical protein LOTGIDRAFT_163642 [Lottia gigantea]ESO90760.1 hypothetical protein LOTGIDRAFT_163642 [Lottia gigantea]